MVLDVGMIENSILKSEKGKSNYFNLVNDVGWCISQNDIVTPEIKNKPRGVLSTFYNSANI